MTTNSLPRPVNFTRADLNAVINDALSKVRNDPKWIARIYKAAGILAAGQFAFDGYVVTLRSASSDRVYRISVEEPMRCDCPAHGPCYHLAAARLILRAAERYAARPAFRSTVVPVTADVQARADALFA